MCSAKRFKQFCRTLEVLVLSIETPWRSQALQIQWFERRTFRLPTEEPVIRSIKVIRSAPRALRHYEYSGLGVTLPIRSVRSTEIVFPAPASTRALQI